MPRVFTAIAAKNYPIEGITKGNTYWYWTPYRGRKRRSSTHPRPSQVEPNDTKANVFGAVEDLADFLAATTAETTKEDVENIIESCKEVADTAYDEMEEKADNIEDGFGHETMQSEEFREYASEIEQWGQDLDSLTPVDNVQDTLDELTGLSEGPAI